MAQRFSKGSYWKLSFSDETDGFFLFWEYVWFMEAIKK